MDTASNIVPLPAPAHRVNKFALKALLDHAGPVDRPNLHRVFASADGSTMVATNGHALLLRHDPMAGVGGMGPAEIRREGISVAADACQAAIKAARARDTIEIGSGTGAITVRSGATVVARIDGTDDSGYMFPPYWQVIPPSGREASGGPVGICGHLLATMAGALTRGGRPRDGSLLRWSFGGPLEPARVDVEPGADGIVDDARWIGIIMPICL